VREPVRNAWRRADARLLRGVADKLSCAAEDVVAAAERAVSERDLHFKNAKVSLQRGRSGRGGGGPVAGAGTKRIAGGIAILSGRFAAGIFV